MMGVVSVNGPFPAVLSKVISTGVRFSGKSTPPEPLDKAKVKVGSAVEDAPAYFDPAFQQGLFDRMGRTYERVGDIGSLGFSRLWRKQAVNALELKPGQSVCDMMSGTGEAWKYLLSRIGTKGRIVAIDFSEEMCRIGQSRVDKRKLTEQIQVIQGDAMATSLAESSMDAVYSAYGVKTLPKSDYPRLVAEVKRLLKPDGKAVFVEVSMPDNQWHRQVFRFYLGAAFPILKKTLGPLAKHFELFNHYLTRYENGRDLASAFQQQGFLVTYRRLLGDGASLVLAQKKNPDAVAANPF